MAVRFLVNPHYAPYIETKPLHSSQMVLERREDGSVIFQITVCQNFELEKSIMEYGEGVRVLFPKSLVNTIRKRLKIALESYE